MGSASCPEEGTTGTGGYGFGSGFALLVVLFILLIIVGAAFFGGSYQFKFQKMCNGGL